MLPIKKVVLYKHGVGYFEREGEVQGDEKIDLLFKSTEMNDVLKSLTVLDLSGGIVSSISYESTKPVEKQLEDIEIRLPDGHAVTGLLSQVKGAKVCLTVGSEEITGKVTGIETMTKEVEGSTVTSYLLGILEDGDSISTVDILEIKKLKFLDESLKTDLGHLLEVLFSAKKKDAKSLTIFARGEGERTVIASYVVETPVWKASYRVIIGDKEPIIQGWALVDNTQDEDWENVNLTLVAGLPISFVHDLYSPRYKKRPVVQVQEEEAYAPPMLEAGMAADLDFRDAFPCEEMAAPPPPASMPLGMGMMAMPASPAPLMKQARGRAMATSTPVQTRTVEVGDLFQYIIKNPVTVKRNQSALVPILQNKFDGKRVAVYNQEVRDKNPLSSLLIKNDTGLTLEGGPMTVLEDETYVGEAMLETIKPGEEKLVPYSVELGCLVTKDHRSETHNIHRVRITGGYMYHDFFRLSKAIYKISNNSDRKMDFFLEHRFNKGWDLKDTPKPYETTENFYRFRFDVGAKDNIKFTVTEEHLEYQTYSLSSLYNDWLVNWSDRGLIDAKTRKALEELIGLSAKMADLAKKIQENEAEVRDIHNEQQRLRENMKALGDSADEKKLRERYVKELNLGEDRLKTLKKEIRDLMDAKKSLEEELKGKINKMQMDRQV